MEGKYRMLSPNLLSTQSIEFKLSEPLIESCTQLSPNQHCDSLTYSVSIETIQDNQISPSKNENHPNSVQKNNKDMQILTKKETFLSNKYLQNSFNFDFTKKFIEKDLLRNENKSQQGDQKEIYLQPNLIDLCLQTNKKNQGHFKKKSILQISQGNNENIKTGTNSRMGKVMSRVYSALKQSQITNRFQKKNFKKKQNYDKEFQNFQQTFQHSPKPQQMLREKNLSIFSDMSEKSETTFKTGKSPQKNTELLQIERRKSEHLVNRNKKNQKMKLNQIFCSDRQKGSRKYQSLNYNRVLKNFNQVRFKNMSTVEPNSQKSANQNQLKQNRELEVYGKKLMLTDRKIKGIHLKNRSISERFNKSDEVNINQRIKLTINLDLILQNIQISPKSFYKCSSANKVTREKTRRQQKQSF